MSSILSHELIFVHVSQRNIYIFFIWVGSTFSFDKNVTLLQALHCITEVIFGSDVPWRRKMGLSHVQLRLLVAFF